LVSSIDSSDAVVVVVVVAVVVVVVAPAGTPLGAKNVCAASFVIYQPLHFSASERGCVNNVIKR